jgi:hypothetical protein
MIEFWLIVAHQPHSLEFMISHHTVVYYKNYYSDAFSTRSMIARNCKTKTFVFCEVGIILLILIAQYYYVFSLLSVTNGNFLLKVGARFNNFRINTFD